MNFRPLTCCLCAWGCTLAASGSPAGAERLTVVADLPAGAPALELKLAPLTVFRPGARIEVHGANGVRDLALPARRDFSGEIAGGGFAVVSLTPEGAARGLLELGGRRYRLRGASVGALVGNPGALMHLSASPVEGETAGADSCDADSTPEISPRGESGSPAIAAAARASAASAALLAIETDWELYLKMGSTVHGVTDHVADRMAVAAAVYRRDVGTDFEIVYLSIWETADDPYNVQSGFLDALYELGDVWHALHPGLARTLVHFMSGKDGIAGGIGYHGVLCTPDTMVSGHWGGGYSLSGAHAGVFGDQRDNFVVAHEIGHNFRAYHTHCFNDLPDDGDAPIDLCYSGDMRNDGHACYAGETSVPPDGGSIMSYCHLQPGGYENIHLSLGQAGSYGTTSERVVARMLAHIQSVSCLAPSDPTIFVDGFESGDPNSWSDLVPVAP